MNIEAPQNQGVVSPPNASHDLGSTDTTHKSYQRSITSGASSIAQGDTAQLACFPSGQDHDPRPPRVAFSGNATILASSLGSQDNSANPQQAFTVRAGGKREAYNDKPQMLRKNLIFY